MHLKSLRPQLVDTSSLVAQPVYRHANISIRACNVERASVAAYSAGGQVGQALGRHKGGGSSRNKGKTELHFVGRWSGRRVWLSVVVVGWWRVGVVDRGQERTSVGGMEMGSYVLPFYKCGWATGI